MNNTIFGFIGLGLIGGSIAKAIRKKYAQYATIYVYDPDQTTQTLALEDSVIDDFFSEISPKLGTCDYLFLCAPVHKNSQNLGLLKTFLLPRCLITDVGSVKLDIHFAIHKHGLETQFIGGHPMAGSEKSGYQNSNALLLENAYYILTPEPSVSKEKIECLSALVSSLGAIPMVMDAKTHDYVTAGISHLPHLIASSLVNFIHSSDASNEYMKTIAAGGFKDITRIASSSPEMWKQVCLSNKDAILSLLSDYILDLKNIEKLLQTENSDDLLHFFANAKEYRDSFATHTSGPLLKIYGCYVDIPDETGVISTIASLLASNEINLKNIGIVHNREFEEGVLQLEFYDATSLQHAEKTLTLNGYKLYKRN